MFANRRTLISSLAAIFITAAAVPAVAHSYKTGAVMIGHPWAEPSDGSEVSVFFPLINGGREPDRLLHATSPAADRVIIQDTLRGNVTPVEALALPPGAPIAMRPGARHLLLKGLKEPLTTGDRVPLMLTFESGQVEVEVHVSDGASH
ncbi:copper chaperone PCu(A)C [Indioceanicola profundi]|uniref:copper chaperone PCu(A)C n=1 Tax=Indioceanicola profundi TaxID=2220096 RepID=UPI000E6ADF10|nr:copper chaperone PCu(A)C [Indioceanicola profundi]